MTVKSDKVFVTLSTFLKKWTTEGHRHLYLQDSEMLEKLGRKDMGTICRQFCCNPEGSMRLGLYVKVVNGTSHGWLSWSCPNEGLSGAAIVIRVPVPHQSRKFLQFTKDYPQMLWDRINMFKVGCQEHAVQQIGFLQEKSPEISSSSRLIAILRKENSTSVESHKSKCLKAR